MEKLAAGQKPETHKQGVETLKQKEDTFASVSNIDEGSIDGIINEDDDEGEVAKDNLSIGSSSADNLGKRKNISKTKR